MEDMSQYMVPYTASVLFYVCMMFGFAECFFYGIFTSHYNNLTRSQRLEWVSNFASSIDSSLAGMGSLAGLLLPLSVEQQFSMIRYIVISITGYSLADILFRVYYRNVLEKPSFQYFLIFHHVLAALAVQVAVMHKEILQAKFLFIFMELSTVFINLRMMILDARVKRASRLYQSMSLLMVVTFFISRILPIPLEYNLVVYRCIYLQELCSPEAAFYMGLNTIPYTFLTIANFFWLHKMLLGIYIHYKKSHDPKGLESIENEVFGNSPS